jgi:hypothetical protein
MVTELSLSISYVKPTDEGESLTHLNLIMLLKLNLIFDPYTTNEMGQGFYLNKTPLSA